MTDALHMFTIYREPTGQPGKFSVRRFVVAPGQVSAGELIGSADTLPQARDLVPYPADTPVPAGPGDDPNIVETWM